MFSSHRMAVVERAAALLILVILLIAGVGITIRRTTTASPAADRIVVADPADQNPTVVQTVAGLEQRGFAVKSAAEVPNLLTSTGPRTVVFTATALQKVSPSTLHALYRQGVVLAALDLSMPDLLSRIGVVLPENSVLPPPSHSWLTPSPNITIFSIVRTANGHTSKISDILYSTDRFLAYLQRAEHNDVPARPAPSSEPSPPLPAPFASATATLTP